MLERLLQDLRREGSVIQRETDDGPLLITFYGGRPLDPPVRLFITAQALDEHLNWIADQGVREVFPDVEPIVGAYRLFTVHLEEEIFKDGRRLTELHLSESGLVASGSELPREVLDPADGPYRWVSERPPAADIDQH